MERESGIRGPDSIATLANEYSYETSENARRCALDVFELLAETDHVSGIAPGHTLENS